MGIEFGIKDIIDILLVAFLMYQTYMLLKGTNAVNIFVGIIAFVVCWFLVSYVFKMQLLGAILDKVMSVGAIALIVIFKDEIRRFFSFMYRIQVHKTNILQVKANICYSPQHMYMLYFLCVFIYTNNST